MPKNNSYTAATIEEIGIEHVPESKRHGTATRAFTVWFAANIGAAGFAIGILVVLGFGLTLAQALPILLISSLAGGLVLGLTAAMGPELGFPQMLISRSPFGRKGNYLPTGFNWISTIGWFTFNTIIGAMALQAIIPSFGLSIWIIMLMLIQVIIAIFGHDMVHVFEKVMSVVLGLVFLAIFISTIPELGSAFAYMPPGASTAVSIGAIGATIAVAFSYVIAWAPYASDYSRYFPKKISKLRVALFAMIGSAIGSFTVELLGAIVAAIMKTPSVVTSNATLFSGIASHFGNVGTVMLAALAAGVVTANALNIYSNSLSALVLDVKAKRWLTVSIGGIIGFALAIAVGTNFVADFENFLLVLDYWITPWIAIMLVDFFIAKRTASTLNKKPRDFYLPTLGIYLLSILLSAPFMWPSVICSASSCAVPFVGALAGIFGNADFSYFISFAIAGVAYFIYRKWKK
jgi:NCS1 family nucleobase:cation symporter-1